MIDILNKKDDWGIREYGNVKISAIQKEISKFSEEWFLDTTRQKPNYTHEHTQMYQLRYFHYDWDPTLPGYYKDVNGFSDPEAIKELQELYNFLETEYKGKVVRAEVINMMPYSRIRKHRDRTDMLFICRRIHIPIKTDPGVTFIVNKDVGNMLAGGVYEINNSKIHNVFNHSSENRIHLIVDVMPEPFSLNVSKVDGDDSWKVDTNILDVDYSTKCIFCISSDYCIGPHVTKENAKSFWEYVGTVIDDLAHLSVDVINDYSQENNVDLSKLSEELYNLIKIRAY